MKAVAFSVKPFEKECLAKANNKKHDITLISNALNEETAFFAEGKEAVLVFVNDDVSENVISLLAGFGVKYIATRSTGTDHIDLEAAKKYEMKVLSIPDYCPEAIAEHSLALALALSRHIVEANNQIRAFDFRIDQLMGFNLCGKTVGIVGYGHIGQAVAKIYNGLGCRVLIYDPALTGSPANALLVSLRELYATSDIITLHLPLSKDSLHMINAETMAQMKHGVMLINTSRGALIKTNELIPFLRSGQIGYLGLDAYEFEKGLFFEDHKQKNFNDKLFEELISFPNVLITPHQGFLTREAVQQIAEHSIENLDSWQAIKQGDQLKKS
jgi:D-lactate dehydrogenase